MLKQLFPWVVLVAALNVATCGGSDKKGNGGGGGSTCECTTDYDCQNGSCACKGSQDYTLTEEEAKQQSRVCKPEGCQPSDGGGGANEGLPDGQGGNGSTDEGPPDGSTDWGGGGGSTGCSGGGDFGGGPGDSGF